MAHEKEFKKSLNPEEKDAYDRAIKERKEIYKNFLKIYHGPLTNEEPAGTSPTEEETETTTEE
jgi:hypothetical protein